MYDWPEIHAANDRLWQCIHDALKTRGIKSPSALDRASAPESAWRSDELLLSQTCGLPLVTSLADRAQVVGSFAYRDTESPGLYHSVLIAREDSPDLLTGFKGKRVAINGLDSYSGCLALKSMFYDHALGDGFFSELHISGGHRQSVKMVARNEADIAAIDCVSWALARRFDEDARRVRVIARTPSRPNLPLITSKQTKTQDLKLMREAITEAIETLDSATSELTGIVGFLSRERADYKRIRSDVDRAGVIRLALQ